MIWREIISAGSSGPIHVRHGRIVLRLSTKACGRHWSGSQLRDDPMAKIKIAFIEVDVIIEVTAVNEKVVPLTLAQLLCLQET